MASIVILDSYNEAGNKFLKLLNGEAGRRLSVGSGWTSLAVGFRWMMTREIAGDITGSPRFTFGLSAGPNTPWSNPANAIGFAWEDLTMTDAGPDDDGQRYYSSGPLPAKAFNKSGTSIKQTSLTILNDTNNRPNNGGTAKFLKTTVFTVTKGSSWTCGMVDGYVPLRAFDNAHRTKEQLITALEQMSLTGCLNSLGTGQFSASSAVLAGSIVDEAGDGYLDSVFFSWNRSNPAGVVISDVFVAKWA